METQFNVASQRCTELETFCCGPVAHMYQGKGLCNLDEVQQLKSTYSSAYDMCEMSYNPRGRQ